MARETKGRTLVDWARGEFEPLQRHLADYKRRGLRIKQLATLGLAAEAQGFSVVVDNGRLMLTGQDAVLVSFAGPAGDHNGASPSPAPGMSEAPATRPEVDKFMLQFVD